MDVTSRHQQITQTIAELLAQHPDVATAIDAHAQQQGWASWSLTRPADGDARAQHRHAMTLYKAMQAAGFGDIVGIAADERRLFSCLGEAAFALQEAIRYAHQGDSERAEVVSLPVVDAAMARYAMLSAQP